MKQVTMTIKIDERRQTVELRRAGCSAPAFTNREREQMALRVCDEYKNLFEIDEKNPSAV